MRASGNEALSHGVDVVRVRRFGSGCTDLRDDLSAMMRAVQADVEQDVVECAFPRFSLGVAVGNSFRQAFRRQGSKKLLPAGGRVGGQAPALVKRKVRPDGYAFAGWRDSLQPQI